MAEKKIEEKKTGVPDPEEMVEYTAPMLYADRARDILAAVNGETIRIRRGVPVRIKRKFVEVLENARAQEDAAYAMMQKAQRNGTKALADM